MPLASSDAPAPRPVPTRRAPDARPADDHDLVARLKSGDDDAYTYLVASMSTRLRAVALRILRNDDAAGEAVQDTLVQAFRAMPRFDGDAQISTWLHRIVINTCLMRLRRARRRPEASLEMLASDPTLGGTALRLEARGDSVDRVLEQQEQTAALYDALAGLPAPHRTVLRLRDLEERSTREAADALGVSDNAVKLRLLRARRALGRRLQHRLRSGPRRRPRHQEHA